MIKELNELYDYAVQTYKANGRTDYDAGIVQGIKQAIEIVKQEAEKIGSLGKDL